MRVLEETYLPGMNVSLAARRHRISGSQVFNWRRLISQGALTAATAGEEVVPASSITRSRHRSASCIDCSAKKAMENELHGEAVSRAAGRKRLLLRSTSLPGDGQ